MLFKQDPEFFVCLFVTGPSVLDVFNTLLRHLKTSVDNKSLEGEKRNMEKKFEEAIINTIGMS